MTYIFYNISTFYTRHNYRTNNNTRVCLGIGIIFV